MWNELGISGGTAIVILIALYFVIKWAVKNGIKEAYSAITGRYPKRKRGERTWIGFRRSITSSLWNRLKGSIICSILFLTLQWQ